MTETAETDDEKIDRSSEPRRMSWFVASFMTLCLLMTGAMIYYAWQVFEAAV